MSWVSRCWKGGIKEQTHNKFFRQPDRRLSEAEQNLNVANLSMRMENLNEYKNYHNSLLKQHQTTILHLEQEVITIKAIADALPEDCFKRTRLEPI